MDADKDGCIDKEEWAKHMTHELKAAIEAKLSDSGLVAGFKPLVDIAKVFDQLDTDKSGDLLEMKSSMLWKFSVYRKTTI